MEAGPLGVPGASASGATPGAHTRPPCHGQPGPGARRGRGWAAWWCRRAGCRHSQPHCGPRWLHRVPQWAAAAPQQACRTWAAGGTRLDACLQRPAVPGPCGHVEAVPPGTHVAATGLPARPRPARAGGPGMAGLAGYPVGCGHQLWYCPRPSPRPARAGGPGMAGPGHGRYYHSWGPARGHRPVCQPALPAGTQGRGRDPGTQLAGAASWVCRGPHGRPYGRRRQQG